MTSSVPSPQDKPRRVRAIFSRIAPRYDLMNRLMTAGQDLRWRREVIRRAALQPHQRLLDLGAGTGDLAYEALRQQPLCQPVAGDFTLEMMQVGRQRPGGQRILWSGADALNLPFPDEQFDAVVSGFLLRNVADLDRALQEQYRVLKPGGHWVALDTTPPRRNLLWPFIQLHFRLVIPLLGTLLAGDPAAYRYLPHSTAHFLPAEALAQRVKRAGFQQVGFRRRMLGTVVILWAVKPARGGQAGPAPP